MACQGEDGPRADGRRRPKSHEEQAMSHSRDSRSKDVGLAQLLQLGGHDCRFRSVFLEGQRRCYCPSMGTGQSGVEQRTEWTHSGRCEDWDHHSRVHQFEYGEAFGQGCWGYWTSCGGKASSSSRKGRSRLVFAMKRAAPVSVLVRWYQASLEGKQSVYVQSM